MIICLASFLGYFIKVRRFLCAKNTCLNYIGIQIFHLYTNIKLSFVICLYNFDRKISYVRLYALLLWSKVISGFFHSLSITILLLFTIQYGKLGVYVFHSLLQLWAGHLPLSYVEVYVVVPVLPNLDHEPAFDPRVAFHALVTVRMWHGIHWTSFQTAKIE